MTLERLQKYLSRSGVASRRQAELWIQEGKVRVNGQVVTELGVKIDPERDRVQVEGRRVVTDLAPKQYGRLYPLGRLDYDATGLMLLTNDGDLAQRLMHPRYQVPRTYRVTVAGQMAQEALRRLAGGIKLNGRDVPTAVALIKSQADKTVLELTVWEGRYHLIKRLLEKVGHPVLKLKRIAFGPLQLGRLARGSCRPLTRRELAALQEASTIASTG
jgi:pseudouridine synthase